jgi:hypothetical protein
VQNIPGHHETPAPPPRDALGVTVLACSGPSCLNPTALGVLQRVGETVRGLSHGMLISVRCPFGPIGCPTRASGPGAGAAVLLAQPCLAGNRRPLGPVLPLGPIRRGVDLDDVCAWLRRPDLDPSTIPVRLRLDRRAGQCHAN